MDCCSEALDFGVVVKHPGERLTLKFDFFSELADFWEAGKFYRTGELSRPLKATGFVNQALNDGTSANLEPRWARQSGAETRDGSVQWKSIPATNQAIDIINDAIATPSAGLTVPALPAWDGAFAMVVVEGGSDGADDPLECKVTTQRGQVLVGIAEIQVRKNRAAC